MVEVGVVVVVVVVTACLGVAREVVINHDILYNAILIKSDGIATIGIGS